MELLHAAGICPDAVHSVGPGREMRRVLHSCEPTINVRGVCEEGRCLDEDGKHCTQIPQTMCQSLDMLAEVAFSLVEFSFLLRIAAHAYLSRPSSSELLLSSSGWGISAEFEPRAVFHGHDASEDEAADVIHQLFAS